MFPQAEENTIDTAISTTSTFEEAVDALLIPNESTDEGIVLLLMALSLYVIIMKTLLLNDFLYNAIVNLTYQDNLQLTT